MSPDITTLTAHLPPGIPLTRSLLASLIRPTDADWRIRSKRHERPATNLLNLTRNELLERLIAERVLYLPHPTDSLFPPLMRFN